MIGTLITIFIILAAFALVYWGMSQLTLPPTIKVVIVVIMGLIALAFIWNLFAGGGGGLHAVTVR
jgi:hypothetical protein